MAADRQAIGPGRGQIEVQRGAAEAERPRIPVSMPPSAIENVEPPIKESEVVKLGPLAGTTGRADGTGANWALAPTMMPVQRRPGRPAWSPTARYPIEACR